jgi:hypothetical protein
MTKGHGEVLVCTDRLTAVLPSGDVKAQAGPRLLRHSPQAAGQGLH